MQDLTEAKIPYHEEINTDWKRSWHW